MTLRRWLLAPALAFAVAGCTQELADTLCLSNADCPTGTTCGENPSGDRVCLAGAGDAGGDTATDTGTDVPLDGGEDTGSDTGGDTGVDVDPDGIDPVDVDPDGGPADVMQREICDNGRDDNGDGAVDCDDDQCEDLPICLCGNGVIDGDEDCDGDDLDGETCEEFGFNAGELGCNDRCEFVLAGCRQGEPTVLRYDDWSPGEPLEFERSITQGDVAVSCYETPSDDIEYAVLGVQFGYGGAPFDGEEGTVEIFVWELDSPGRRPEDVLHAETFRYFGSERELVTQSLVDAEIRVSGWFCIGIGHEGLFSPTIAADNGVDHPELQWLRRDAVVTGLWVPVDEATFGDWVLRASVAPVSR